MHLVMFDIDGTLVESYEADAACYAQAVREVLLVSVDEDWASYRHVTDSGILDEILDVNGIEKGRAQLHIAVKERFLKLMSNHMERHGLERIPGAGAFLRRLLERDDVIVCLATGGWEETARLKLRHAGLDLEGVALASGSDHFDRTEIMKISRDRAGVGNCESATYFGDGPWDRDASERLGYGFVLVGDRVDHRPKIRDYSDLDHVLGLIG